MQKLTMNKNVYDTMLGHFGDELDKIAEEFNDYLTPKNVIDDYHKATGQFKFTGSQGKTITFVTHFEPSVKAKLNSTKVKQLDVEFEMWFDRSCESDPHRLLGQYFQLFIVRKLDYFGTHIISSEDKDYDKFAGIHPSFLSHCEDSTERRIAALMGILLSNCSASDQRRLMTIIKLKYQAERPSEENEFTKFFDIIDMFIYAQQYKDL